MLTDDDIQAIKQAVREERKEARNCLIDGVGVAALKGIFLGIMVFSLISIIDALLSLLS